MTKITTKNTAKKKHSYYKSTLFIALIMVGILFMATQSDRESVLLETAEIKGLNQGWMIEEGFSSSGTLNLPQKLGVDPGNTVIISRLLPEDFRMPQTIRLRSSMENVKVYLEGDKIYDNTLDKTKKIPYMPEGSLWALIDIPNNSQGRLIQVEVSTNIELMSLWLNEVYYGARGDLIFNLLSDQMASVCIAIFILSLALITFIVSMTVKLENDKRMNHLAIFTMSIGIWLISEMDIMQIFVGNHYFVSTISYLMLPVASMSFTLFMKEAVLKRFSKVLNTFVLILASYLAVSTLLQRLGDINYIEIWYVFIVLLLGLIISIMAMLIYEAYKKTPQAIKYIIFISIMIGTVLIESVMFLTGEFMTVSQLSDFGIAAFLIFIVVDTLYYVRQMLYQEGESKYLREIAYKDSLTGGLNRAAFEEEIDFRLSVKNKKPFRLTMFDLNNLKHINDQYGHEMGDEALKYFYEAIATIYDGNAMCYRVGGDEFMVIEDDVCEDRHHEAIKRLKGTIKAMGEHRNYQVDTAIGSDVYHYNRGFGDFKHDVDMKMYQDKRKTKSVSNNEYAI